MTLSKKSVDCSILRRRVLSYQDHRLLIVRLLMYHALLATNDASPSFDNHNIRIGSLLLRKMGYTGRGLGKNGQGIVVPISHMIQTYKACFGYDVASTSLPTPGLAEHRKVLFVAGGI